MIDFSTERVISMNEAIRMLPRVRNGKRINYCTVWRWANKGCGGVVLETIRVGGSLCTSIEAIQRFIDARSPEHTPTPEAHPRFRLPMRTPAARRRAIEAAMRALDKAGIK